MPAFTLKVGSRLFLNGLRFRYLRWTGKAGRPQAISLEVTHHCIAKCIMCNIWRIPPEVPDLPARAWLDLLSSDLFSDLREVDITGGEPFLRRDLPGLFSGICQLKKRNLEALKSIAVTTNGFLVDRVFSYTRKILPDLMASDVDLVMVCALDAIGELHDEIRNYKGGFERVNQTVEGLVRLREEFPNLIIGLKTTVLPMNVGQLGKIVEYADRKGLFTIISPCIVTKGRYLNVEIAERLRFSGKDLREMVAFYEGGNFKWSYHGEKLLHYLKTGLMRKPCSCGFNYFFIRSNGDLFLCPLIDFSLGNVEQYPIQALFFSAGAAKFRNNVGRFPECRRCTEPGLERYALPYEGFACLFLLFKMGRRRFLEFYRHMGFEKYCS